MWGLLLHSHMAPGPGSGWIQEPAPRSQGCSAHNSHTPPGGQRRSSAAGYLPAKQKNNGLQPNVKF